MSEISKEIATKEVDRWLTDIGIEDDQKEALKNNVNIIVAGVMSGKLIINDTTNEIIQKLRVPFGKEEKVSELKFKTDLRVGEIENFKKSISEDYDNRATFAAVCASTGNPFAVISQMNSKDFNTSAAIVLFFIV